MMLWTTGPRLVVYIQDAMHTVALYISYDLQHFGNTAIEKNVKFYAYNQGPVVHSIVSFTISLRGQLIKCFTTL